MLLLALGVIALSFTLAHQILSLPLGCDGSNVALLWFPQGQPEPDLASSQLAPTCDRCPAHLVVLDGLPDNMS